MNFERAAAHEMRVWGKSAEAKDAEAKDAGVKTHSSCSD